MAAPGESVVRVLFRRRPNIDRQNTKRVQRYTSLHLSIGYFVELAIRNLVEALTY